MENNMNKEIVNIQEHQVHRIEYKGQPVLTTTQLAELLGVTEKTILNNFGNHRDQFKEDVHVIQLKGERLKEFRLYSQDMGIQNISPKTRKFNLWTAKGAINHVKITDSPKAWAIYHDMVDVYFGEKPPLPERTSSTRKLTTRQLTSALKAFCDVAKFFGLEGNQALLSANQAVERQHGVNLMNSVGITHLLADQQDILLTTTDVGKRLGLTRTETYPFLEKHELVKGFRDQKDRQQWELTDEGKRFGIYQDTGKKQKDGTPIRQIKWNSLVVDSLKQRVVA